jgi:hypothetical protein
MVVVDQHDPAFATQMKFFGPAYTRQAAEKLSADKDWIFRREGSAWRRVVASPQPREILEAQPVTWLLDPGRRGHLCGRRGIPMMYPSTGSGELTGVETVIDKDLASDHLLARDHRFRAVPAYPGGRLHHRLERVHGALGLALLPQAPSTAFSTVSSNSRTAVFHCLIAKDTTAAATRMICM